MSLTNAFQELKETNINELEFENIGVWPVAIRALLLLLGSALLIFLFYYFHIKDQRLHLVSIQQEEGRLKNTFQQKAFEAANLEAYQEQMKELEESFGTLLAQLPSSTEVPGLLENITEIGHGSSLKIETIEPQAERVAEFYVELPIKIEAAGGYHDFGSFVSGVASLPRIVTLHDFSIVTNKKGGIQNLDIEARTYRYKAQGE